MRRTSFCFLLLFSGFFLATGFAQSTGHYTIHLTPQAVKSPTPAHSPSIAPARLTSQQKSEAFKQMVQQINKDPALQTALLGGNKGNEFPVVQKITGSPTSTVSAGGTITLTPDAISSGSVAYLEFFYPESLFGHPATVQYSGAPQGALQVVLSTRQPHMTYMLDFTVNTSLTSMSAIVFTGGKPPAPMTLPVTDGHLLVPVFAESAQSYVIKVEGGKDLWRFHSVEIEQEQ